MHVCIWAGKRIVRDKGPCKLGKFSAWHVYVCLDSTLCVYGVIHKFSIRFPHVVVEFSAQPIRHGSPPNGKGHIPINLCQQRCAHRSSSTNPSSSKVFHRDFTPLTWPDWYISSSNPSHTSSRHRRCRSRVHDSGQWRYTPPPGRVVHSPTSSARSSCPR